MLAPGTVGRPIAVRSHGAASSPQAQSAVFLTVWLVMRRHVDLLRLASAMCHV